MLPIPIPNLSGGSTGSQRTEFNQKLGSVIGGSRGVTINQGLNTQTIMAIAAIALVTVWFVFKRKG